MIGQSRTCCLSLVPLFLSGEWKAIEIKTHVMPASCSAHLTVLPVNYNVSPSFHLNLQQGPLGKSLESLTAGEGEGKRDSNAVRTYNWRLKSGLSAPNSYGNPCLLPLRRGDARSGVPGTKMGPGTRFSGPRRMFGESPSVRKEQPSPASAPHKGHLNHPSRLSPLPPPFSCNPQCQ